MKKVGIMANPRRDIDLEYTKNVIGFLQNKVKIYIEEEIVPFLAPDHGFELLTAQNADEFCRYFRRRRHDLDSWHC